MLNKDTITKLIELNKDDRKTLEFIKSRIDSFEQYHRAVFDDQMFQLAVRSKAMSIAKAGQRLTRQGRFIITV